MRRVKFRDSTDIQSVEVEMFRSIGSFFVAFREMKDLCFSEGKIRHELAENGVCNILQMIVNSGKISSFSVRLYTSDGRERLDLSYSYFFSNHRHVDMYVDDIIVQSVHNS